LALNNLAWIVWYETVVQDLSVVQQNGVSERGRENNAYDDETFDRVKIPTGTLLPFVYIFILFDGNRARLSLAAVVAGVR